MLPRNTLPKVCIALGFSEATKLLEHAQREVEAGERFLEFRLDYLNNIEGSPKIIRDFLAKNPECYLLATCRRHQNQGKFNGSIEEQIKLLEIAIKAGACAVDVEIESAENAVQRVATLRNSSHLVLSYHNFDGTPVVEQVLRRMMKIPADIYKLVTTAKKPSDNSRVLSLVRSHSKESLVVLAMGETGFPTRVLSPGMGGTYTYAAPNAAEGTASGQVSAKQLHQLYRVEKLGKNTKVYGVIADPVRHSISPAVHNRGFQARRIDSVYLPFLVHPAQLKDLFEFAEALPIHGFSVTIPHKQKVLRYLDAIDPLSRRIGAVNTVWKKAGRWRGTNTDSEGVTVPLAKHIRLAKASILLVGNGGAARSAAFAFVDAGAKLSIVGRNPDRVRALAKACGGEAVMADHLNGRKFDVVVHATPLGMHPHVNECFFDGDIPGEIVFDMVYNPLETMLLKRAKEQGKKTISGLEMFIEQAVRQFEIWTGESAPRAVMEKAALESLGCNNGN